MLLVVAMILVLFVVDQIKRQKELNDFTRYAPIQIEAPPEINAETGKGLGEAADSDATLQGTLNRVVIENMNELAKTPLPDRALWTLETYLSAYFNYYLDNDTHYYAEFLPDTYVSNKNLPCFTIHVKDLEMDVVCTWYASRNIYHFTSDFNPNGE